MCGSRLDFLCDVIFRLPLARVLVVAAISNIVGAEIIPQNWKVLARTDF